MRGYRGEDMSSMACQRVQFDYGPRKRIAKTISKNFFSLKIAPNFKKQDLPGRQGEEPVN